MWRPAVGRDNPARLVITTTPPHPLVLASSACPRAVSLAPAGQFTFSFISAGAAKIHSLRCSSSPQRDPASAVINGRGGARERSEGCPRLGVLSAADFVRTTARGSLGTFHPWKVPRPGAKYPLSFPEKKPQTTFRSCNLLGLMIKYRKIIQREEPLL